MGNLITNKIVYIHFYDIFDSLARIFILSSLKF